VKGRGGTLLWRETNIVNPAASSVLCANATAGKNRGDSTPTISHINKPTVTNFFQRGCRTLEPFQIKKSTSERNALLLSEKMAMMRFDEASQCSNNAS
jgi:hypothetical protein